MTVDSIIISTLVGYFITYLSFYYLIVERKREKRKKRKEKFFNVLSEGLKSGSITTLDDVVNVYKGVSGLESEDLSYRYGLSKLLREFLVEVISKKVDRSLDDETIREWKEKITKFIKENEDISPYADLPAAERNILSDITTFLDMGDADAVKRKILELAGMIQARHDDLNRIRSINKWTVPLSVIGLILTVIFGMLALI